MQLAQEILYLYTFDVVASENLEALRFSYMQHNLTLTHERSETFRSVRRAVYICQFCLCLFPPPPLRPNSSGLRWMGRRAAGFSGKINVCTEDEEEDGECRSKVAIIEELIHATFSQHFCSSQWADDEGKTRK